ncbi:MAG: hypothetical protein ACMZ66_13230 [Thalassospira sp.]|uniref:hypothetical protein n=1 Tax=Thalassospira sp. TaxID=1912094 RepID=UPI003A8A1198
MGGVLKLVGGFFSGSTLWWLIGAVGVGLIAFAGMQTLRLNAAEARVEAADIRVARWRDANIQNMETIDRLRLARTRIEVALSDERDRRSKSEARYKSFIEGVNDAPENGCVGPAVRGLFDRLRGDGAGTDSGDPSDRGRGSG